MTFERPWVLLFAILPLVWMLLELRSARRKSLVVLKALSIVAILVAISEPQITISETKMAVAMLVDTSASISEEDLARESQLVAALQKARGRNVVQVIPFSRTPQDLPSDASAKLVRVARSSGPDGQATDLEAAVRGALASLPAGLVPHIVLVSDGKENAGSVTRGAWQARNLGVPIDTIAVRGKPQPGLRVESITLPTLAFTGEHFPVNMVVTSPQTTKGTIEISAEGKTLGSTPISLEKGPNEVHLNASIATPGALNLGLTIHAPSIKEDVNVSEAITLRRPRVLFVSQDPDGTEKHLLDSLAAAQFDVERTNDTSKGTLADFQLVVLNNLNLEILPAARKDELESFVKRGGGLLVIGGERNIYPEGKKTEDALDRALPAKLAPPRSPEGTAVVLIIDKSSSMEGKKIELARLAAIGVVDNLRPIDSVGVLIFDNSFQWAVPMRRAEDKSLIKRLISGITPDGGTQIAPALSEAFHKILPSKSTFKHIVLLTDGISEEGDSLEVSKEALDQHVTISTVGLGQDVNRAYLEKIAQIAAGKSYFLNEPSGLEQILLRDVMEHTGSTAVEKQLKAIADKPTEVLEGVGIESAPALKGYVRFQEKPTSDTVLKIDEKDPLFVRWQYGLGRSAVFASDAKARWAADWVTWPGFDRFWANVFHDMLPHAEATEAKAEYDSASGDLIVDYRLGKDVDDPGQPPSIFVLGPGGFQKAVPITKMADGAYRGRIAIGQRQGLFRVRPLVETRAFPEVGLYRQEQEQLDFGSNEFLLRQIASYTGGRFSPSPSQVFDSGGRSIPSLMRLWPGLLGLAILLNLTELFLRKVRTT
ncbi:MAG TPA: VWA domain-containing protein [Bryobacteraceae bacterium]|nr:VWA domain-containing protein [Bryobacteraceae bacterium]